MGLGEGARCIGASVTITISLAGETLESTLHVPILQNATRLFA